MKTATRILLDRAETLVAEASSLRGEYYELQFTREKRSKPEQRAVQRVSALLYQSIELKMKLAKATHRLAEMTAHRPLQFPSALQPENEVAEPSADLQPNT